MAEQKATAPEPADPIVGAEHAGGAEVSVEAASRVPVSAEADHVVGAEGSAEAAHKASPVIDFKLSASAEVSAEAEAAKRGCQPRSANGGNLDEGARQKQ